MPADRLAEDLHHEVGEPVDHAGLVAEAIGRVHHAQHLDDALDPVEAPDARANRREQREPDLARDLVALLDRELAADLAARGGLAVGPERPMTRDEEQAPDAHRSDVVREWRGELRERDGPFLETRFCAHSAGSSSV